MTHGCIHGMHTKYNQYVTLNITITLLNEPYARSLNCRTINVYTQICTCVYFYATILILRCASLYSQIIFLQYN